MKTKPVCVSDSRFLGFGFHSTFGFRTSDFRPSQHGSVLILVVVLVVLLALMGTAFLNTTRTDRATSAQNTTNTQVDMLVESVKEMAKAVILEDLYDAAGTYRPPLDLATAPTPKSYDHWDAPELATNSTDPTAYPANSSDDRWLSPRLPTVPDETIVADLTTPNAPYWRAIAPPLIDGLSFDSPFAVDGAAGVNGSPNPARPTIYPNRLYPRILPTYIQPPSFAGPVPAWWLDTGTTDDPTPRWLLAGDADGDGIADSGLWKLPVGEIDGVTYYAAVRIIDNNSAVNVNTALSRTADFNDAGATADPNGFFRSSVGLAELLHTYDPATLAPGAGTVGNQTELFKSTAELCRNSYPDLTAPTVDDPASAAKSQPGTFDFISLGDALEHQVARRVENPGPNSPTVDFRAFSLSDQLSLAWHFTLASPDLGKTKLETALDETLYAGATNKTSTLPLPPNTGTWSPSHGRSSYPADRAVDWFNENFAYAQENSTTTAQILATFRPKRALLVIHNPVSNLISPRNFGALPPEVVTPPPNYSGMAAYRDTPTKTNVNSADFAELWRAFWCVMTENQTTTGTPFTGADHPVTVDGVYDGMNFEHVVFPYAADAENHPQRMFRSSIRDFRAASIPQPPPDPPVAVTPIYLDSRSQLLLRSSIAAAQAVQLRRAGTDYGAGAPVSPVVRRIRLTNSTTTDSATYDVTVFGFRPQVFISEVYAQTDIDNPGPNGETANPKGYMAIELYNPGPGDVTLDSTWHIVALRKPGDPADPDYRYPLTAPVAVDSFPNTTIPEGGYVLVENLGAGADGANYRPPSSGLPATTPIPGAIVAPLHIAFDHELVITRTVTDPEVSLTDDCPIDSFDFTALQIVSGFGEAWHYARPTDAGNEWQCVYPGRYDATAVRRQQGTEYATPWFPLLGPPNPATDTWDDGTDERNVAPTLDSTNPANTVPTYPKKFTIQLRSSGWPGTEPLSSSTTNKFPFGGFARKGDLLQTPFIGAYVIKTSTGGLMEMNSISMDAAWAEDTFADDDQPQGFDDGMLAREHIGRFCPVAEIGAPVTVNDFDNTPGSSLHRYAWARDLFDYLTVSSPHDDYLPRVAPKRWHEATFSADWPVAVDNDGDRIAADAPQDPIVGAVPAEANVGEEDAQPTQGLININTAPWRVLAALPMLPPGDFYSIDFSSGLVTPGSNGRDDNEDLARAIVQWRDGDPAVVGAVAHGPFRSVMDLLAVPAFRNAQPLLADTNRDSVWNAGEEPDDAAGDYSPPGAGTDRVHHDFEEQFLLLNRVSNLITTRSDSFTVYVLVQGWRGVGTNRPEMVVQRRAAFIQDRSPVTQTNSRLPAAVNVPND